MNLQESRIINMRMKVCGHMIDAAIDCDYVLHCYGEYIRRENTVAVELYCFDQPDWDVEVVYFEGVNNQAKGDGVGHILRTVVDIEDIRRAARQWVRRMEK